MDKLRFIKVNIQYIIKKSAVRPIIPVQYTNENPLIKNPNEPPMKHTLNIKRPLLYFIHKHILKWFIKIYKLLQVGEIAGASSNSKYVI